MIKIYNKILFFSDGSAHSDNVAEQIVEFQKDWNCNVVVFHSMKHKRYIPTLYSDNHLQAIDYKDIKEFYKELGKEILEKTKRIFDRAHVAVEIRLIEDEEPEDYIKRIVKEEEFDLVILSSGGLYSKFQKKFLETISKKILKYAPCDVLIVR